MLEELKKIDTSAVEELAVLKEEQRTLEGRLGTMDERRDKVTDVVYERVRRDYTSRLDDLEEKARPLKEEARREYAKLRALYESIESSLQTAALDKEELEFRHELGEFEDKDFKKELEACEKRLQEEQAHLDETEGVRSRFLEVFGSEDELLMPSQTPPPEEEVPQEPAQEEQEEHEETADGDQPTAPFPVSDEAPPPPPGSATVVMGSESFPTLLGDDLAHLAPPSPAPDEVEEPEGEAPPDATVVFIRSRLLEMKDGEPVNEYALGPASTSIGRGAENEIILYDESVSRQHAAVVATPGGFTLCDLRSENGTYVNDERITEQPLTDGDIIQIGTTTFMFRKE